MTTERIEGVFDWYADQKGYGLIRGNDGREYFAHHSNIPTNLRPREGMRVSFLARPRPKGKEGLDAYDIQVIKERPRSPGPSNQGLAHSVAGAKTPSPSPVTPVRKQPIAPAESTSDTGKAVQEALRLRRERRSGLIPDRVDDLAPGTRVIHSQYGAGTVELAGRDTVSVRLDSPSRIIIDLPRDTLRPAAVSAPSSAQPPAETRKAFAKAASPGERTALQIGDLVRKMAGEVKEVLSEEGLDSSGIYVCEPAIGPSAPPQPLTIDPRVAEAFTSAGITHFYSHQVQARESLLAGRHVLISTPTASGKTEAFNPTILEALIKNPLVTALYVFPLVALGDDQTGRLNSLNATLPAGDRLAIGIYNNSVGEDEKKATLYRDNRILVTTPDSLHYIFLPKPYPNWRKFYQNLRYIVLDEAHVYRGVLGANMANIVRRLLVRCRRLGNPQFPQIIISSATVRHPAQLAHQLTGLPAEQFDVIDRSGAPSTDRHFLVTRSDIHELDALCADLLDVKTKDGRTGELRPVRTIVFLKSINEVKRSTERLRQHLRKAGRGHLEDCVEEYYADKGDKNDILQYVKQGKVRCLFTTTALMAGIDIGGLDVAIVKHFPGLVMDARQMFGRAGRVGEGAVIFIADRTDPFDQFYFERPAQLFRGPTEDVVANPENPYLLAAHLKCAAQTSPAQYNNTEGPLAGRWVELFGTMGKDLLDLLVEERALRIRAGNYHLDAGEPHSEAPLNNIRSMETESYVLTNIQDGSELEKKRKATAFRDAHPEAIVLCNGAKYRVFDLNEETRQIKCRPEPETNLRTQGVEEREVAIESIDSTSQLATISSSGGGAIRGNGRVKITNSVRKYLIYRIQTVMQCRSRRCRHETPNLDISRCPKCGGSVRVKQTEKVLEDRPIPQDPPLTMTLNTRATWLDFPTAIQQQFEREFWPRWVSDDGREPTGTLAPSFIYAIHSLEHALLKAFPERIRCDREEIGGLYVLRANDLAARVFIYDNFPGGLGLADDFFQDPLPILEGALDLIERCTCDDEDGCPVCLDRYGCRSLNTMLSKLAGRYLLRLLLGQDTALVIRDLEEFVRTCIPSNRVVVGSA